MFTDPKRIVFEKREDVVDYISRGLLPPTKAHFNEVINKVRIPDPNNEISYAKRGKEVVILDTVVTKEDKGLDSLLTRVYENRVRNCKKLLVGIGAIAAGVIYGMQKCAKNKKHDIEDDHEFDYTDDNGNKIKVIRF